MIKILSIALVLSCVFTPLTFGTPAEDMVNSSVIVTDELTGLGSGTIVKLDENSVYILTALHVVIQYLMIRELIKIIAPPDIRDYLLDNYPMYVEYIIDKTIVKNKVEIIDIAIATDLALLKVDLKDEFIKLPNNLPKVEFFVTKIAKTEPKIGEECYVVGNPLGIYIRNISKGIVSIPKYFDNRFMVISCFATDGNSGGAVYNKNREMIGMIDRGVGYTQEVPESSVVECIRNKNICSFLRRNKVID